MSPDLEAHVDIAVAPDELWPLVSDLRRMPEWSPQVTSTRLKDAEEVAQGVRFTNRNHRGELEWTTHGEVVRCEPGRELAFRIAENWVVWSFTLEPRDGGTRLVQRRSAPEGISALSLEWTDTYLGGQESFTTEMRAGMAQTLAAIKQAAEAAAVR